MVLPYIRLLRPHQWIKNLLLLLPPFFAGIMFVPSVLKTVVPAFIAFCCVSSCGYIINDIKDREADSNHDIKKNRDISSGRIPVRNAVLVTLVLYLAAMMLSMSINGEYRWFQWFVLLYLLNSLLYTFFFKKIVIVDIFLVALGFLFRVLAGGEAFGVPVSSWLFLTVFTVSLMLAAGKRLGELVSMGANAYKHRENLSLYSTNLLEGILWFSASTSLVMYALYSLDQKKGLFYTVPLAAFGLIRYISIVQEGRGDPTDALLKDRQITVTGLIWLLVIGLIIY